MQYRSSFELLGLPFVHVATGTVENGRFVRGVARGWIAVGDVAFGVLLSVGGISFGGVALGGLAVGALPIAGLAIGGCALGGLAIGWLALGGLAIGVRAAIGGAAIAKGFAVGGLALAEHANDRAARAYVEESAMGYGRAVLDHSRWFLLLLLVPVLGGLRRRSTTGADEA
jgi:hypothetical protein